MVELAQFEQYGSRYTTQLVEDGQNFINYLTFTPGDYDSDGFFDLGMHMTYFDETDSPEVPAQRFDVYFGSLENGLTVGALNAVPALNQGFRIDNVSSVKALGDLNNDRYTDFEFTYSTGITTLSVVVLGVDPQTLNGTVPIEQIQSDNVMNVSSSVSQLFEIGDFNSDGRTDLLMTPTASQNTGSTFPIYAVTNLTLPVEFDDDSNLLSDVTNVELTSAGDVSGANI